MYEGTETEFLPADRADAQTLAEDAAAVVRVVPAGLLDMLPVGVVVLNLNRQIVLFNEGFRSLTIVAGNEDPTGLRPGEALGCVHGCASDSGCGTTRFCRYCGAALAILDGLRGRQAVEDCRMVRKGAVGDEALDLQVFASPLKIGTKTYCVCTALDISHEKRRNAMERVFFHDVLNSASGMRMLAGLLEDGIGPEREEAGALLSQSSEKLIDLIMAQKTLLAAEQGRLEVCASDTDSVAILERVRAAMDHHPEARERLLEIPADAEILPLVTDAKLLALILGHLTLNALEASEPLARVVLDCREEGGEVVFTVRNEGVMPDKVQLQLFKRSFSTKGAGRGLGLYAARLIGEDYLGGRLTFVSALDTGTVFSLCLPRGA